MEFNTSSAAVLNVRKTNFDAERVVEAGRSHQLIKMADYDILFCHPEAFLSRKEDLELLQSDVYRSRTVKAAVIVDEAYCILECVSEAALPAPHKGANMCSYNKTKTSFVLKKNVTTTGFSTTEGCGLKGFPGLQCKTARYEYKVRWIPTKKTYRFRVYSCCPGWRGYRPGVGCLEKRICKVGLPHKDHPYCRAVRSKTLDEIKNIYKLGYIKLENMKQPLPFPVTDIPARYLVGLHFKDPFTRQWMALYIDMLRKNLERIIKFPATHRQEFTEIAQYEDVYYQFLNAMKTDPVYKSFYRYPFEEGPFETVINNHTWREDRVFSEQRLAGLNPMSIKRVTTDGESVGVKWSYLQSKLDPNYDWEGALQKALGQTLPIHTAVAMGVVFVVHYPLYSDLQNVADLFDGDSRRMWRSQAPIALFVSRPGTGSQPTQLRAVAIQLDTKPDSPVYSPDDGDLWMLAKESLQVTDFAHVQMIEHLLKTHIMMEPFCVCIHRHLAPQHPLHQILKYHCRGLLPTNKIGFPKLMSENGYMHRLFAIGHVGSLQLLLRGYMMLNWADTDFRTNIKQRGMDNKSKLPYYPYRDDGEVIYEALETFARDYIDNYYKKDMDVARDVELQALANEMSSEGKGPGGGRGKLKGFPASVVTKSGLVDIITRLIWTSSVQHSAVNYPITMYGAFTPNMPSKMYDDTRVSNHLFDIHRLPSGNVSATQAGVAMSLGSLHYDDLLDYGSNLPDKIAGAIVQKHYERMNKVIKPLLDRRNRRRYQEGHLAYPFLTPGWIPNSICT